MKSGDGTNCGTGEPLRRLALWDRARKLASFFVRVRRPGPRHKHHHISAAGGRRERQRRLDVRPSPSRWPRVPRRPRSRGQEVKRLPAGSASATTTARQPLLRQRRCGCPSHQFYCNAKTVPILRWVPKNYLSPPPTLAGRRTRRSRQGRKSRSREDHRGYPRAAR